MRTNLNELASIGIVKDKHPHELPVGAWSDGDNVTFRENHIQKAGGNTESYSGLLFRPYWLLSYEDPQNGDYYWIYPGLNDAGAGKIGTVTKTTHADRTRVSGDYSPNATIPWTGGVLNGLVVVNNGVDAPQMWDRTGGTLNANFEDLDNWPVDGGAAHYKCRCIRPFKNFLVAMDITVDDQTPSRNPFRVMWSDAADPYTAPSTWIAGAANLAGDVYLAEGGDHVIDGAPLRGNFIIYKENSTYIMRYIGGNAVMQVDRLFSEHGILAPRCVATFGDGMHFVVTKGDVIVHDGNTANSIADARVRKEIFDNIDSTYYQMAFCTPYYKEEEIWFCYSTEANEHANKAAIWNYKMDAWSFRELNNCPHIAYGFVDNEGISELWNTVGLPNWNAHTGVWSQNVFTPTADDLLMIEHGDTDTIANAKLQQVDSGNTFDGTTMLSYLRMEKIDMIQADEAPGVIKYLRRLYPKVQGGPLRFRVGSSMSDQAPVVWSDYTVFNANNGDYKIDTRQTGRYLALEISSEADVSWQLDSVELEYEIVSNGR